MTSVIFISVVGGVLLALASLAVWDMRRKTKRRLSKRQERDGTFVWIDFDGSQRRSKSDPDAPGGEWHQGGDWSDGGDGGGGAD